MGGFWLFWGDFDEVRSEEGPGVVGLIWGSTAVREDFGLREVGFVGSLMAPRAARPAGSMRLAQAGRGER